MKESAEKLKIKRSEKTMSIAQYADSGLYLGKTITTARVWQLINEGVLRKERNEPAMVYADKIS